jgi:hypothetical protein
LLAVTALTLKIMVNVGLLDRYAIFASRYDSQTEKELTLILGLPFGLALSK